jgi:hypothetical protein
MHTADVPVVRHCDVQGALLLRGMAKRELHLE